MPQPRPKPFCALSRGDAEFDSHGFLDHYAAMQVTCSMKGEKCASAVIKYCGSRGY